MSTPSTDILPAIEAAEYTLPAYWASYLINGDASGIEDSDQADCDAFIASIPGWYCASCADESHFAHRNDSGNGLAGDVLEFTFIKS